MTTELARLYDGVGINWSSNTGKMGTSNTTLSQTVATSIGAIKTSWGEYQDKVTKTAASVGLDMNGVKDKFKNLDDKTKELNTDTDKALTKIQTEWEKVGDLIKQYQKLDGSLYDSIIDACRLYQKA